MRLPLGIIRVVSADGILCHHHDIVDDDDNDENINLHMNETIITTNTKYTRMHAQPHTSRHPL